MEDHTLTWWCRPERSLIRKTGAKSGSRCSGTTQKLKTSTKIRRTVKMLNPVTWIFARYKLTFVSSAAPERQEREGLTALLTKLVSTTIHSKHFGDEGSVYGLGVAVTPAAGLTITYDTVYTSPVRRWHRSAKCQEHYNGQGAPVRRSLPQ